jgi:hypothetical protein|tara:strand:- start:1053 stop:1388 length:336 start_codon:yes stop_codon:yes gene_type:complete
VAEALNQMDSTFFHKENITYDEDEAYQSFKNYHHIIQGLDNFYKNLHGPMSEMNEADVQLKGIDMKLNVMKTDIEQTSIKSINQVAFINIDCLLVVLELSLGVAVNCDNTE